MDDGGIVDKCLRAQSLNIQFKEIAEFRMIKTATIPVIVALEDEAIELTRSLKFAEHKGGILRRLQRYAVQIYPYQFDEIRSWFENPEPGIFVLKSCDLYSEQTGLICRPPAGKAFFG
jgi:CRISPR-associated endonuclease/helicase Cas3